MGKKILKLLTSVSIALLLISCEVKEKLDTPENFTIMENIIKFDQVENASRYRIQVINSETLEKEVFFVLQDQNIDELYLSPGTYDISIQAVGNINYADSSYSDSISYTQTNPYAKKILNGEDLNDTMKINWLGRTYYQSLNETKYFYMTASGFEVKFYGTSLTATFSTGSNDTGKEPHLVVLLDGENNPNNGKLIVLNSATETHMLAEDLEEKEHVVRVLKRSEAIDSIVGLKSIETDGEFLNVPPLKSKKIDFIGASSSVGFGNLAANTNEPKTTQNSDGLKAFAYLTARMLDAEINIFSASGWPMLTGPWGTGNNNIPKAYDYITVYNNVLWNHQEYVPDAIVINLGTNDWSYIQTLAAEKRPQAIENYIQYYVEFIEKLNTLHPDASIIIAYGVNNEVNLYDHTIEVYNRAKSLESNIDVHIIKLPGLNANDGIGSSNHPSLKTHIKITDAFANFFKEELGWEIVFENIEG